MFNFDFMENLLCKFQPADIIAILTIICGTVLKLQGADGVVSTILITIVTFYFGGRFFKASQEDGKID